MSTKTDILNAVKRIESVAEDMDKYIVRALQKSLHEMTFGEVRNRETNSTIRLLTTNDIFKLKSEVMKWSKENLDQTVKLLEAGIITVNEARENLDLYPIDNTEEDTVEPNESIENVHYDHMVAEAINNSNFDVLPLRGTRQEDGSILIRFDESEPTELE